MDNRRLMFLFSSRDSCPRRLTENSPARMRSLSGGARSRIGDATVPGDRFPWSCSCFWCRSIVHCRNGAGGTLHVPALALDRILPLQPGWALVYGALYLFLIILPVFVVRQEGHIRRTVRAYVNVWSIAYVCFLVYPTSAPRPAVVIGEGFVWGLRFLYSADPPYNCFPSLHVAHSFVSALTCFKVNRGVGIVASCALRGRGLDPVHQAALRAGRDGRRAARLRGRCRMATHVSATARAGAPARAIPGPRGSVNRDPCNRVLLGRLSRDHASVVSGFPAVHFKTANGHPARVPTGCPAVRQTAKMGR